MDGVSKCPVMHGAVTSNDSERTTNKEWWPNQLRINILSKEIIKLMDEMYQVVDLKFSYTDSKAIAQAQEGVDVLERNYHDDHVRLKIKGSSWRIEQIQSNINK